MSLIRFAGRVMLASYFIVNGAKSITNPEPLVADAQPLAEKTMPTVKSLVGEQYAAFVPEDPKTLVRLNGVAQVLGGLGLATGMGRRCGAGLIALSMLPHVAASKPLSGATKEEKQDNRNIMIRNVALLGGALLASQDTQGRPGIGWRVGRMSDQLKRSAEKSRKQLTREAKQAEKDARKAAKKMGKQLSGILPE